MQFCAKVCTKITLHCLFSKPTTSGVPLFQLWCEHVHLVPGNYQMDPRWSTYKLHLDLLFLETKKNTKPFEKKGAKLLYDYSRLSEHIIKLHTGCENIYTKSEVISLPLSHTQTHTYRSSLHSGMVPMVGKVQSESVSRGMVTRCQGLSRTCGQGMGKTRTHANTRPHERHKSK